MSAFLVEARTIARSSALGSPAVIFGPRESAQAHPRKQSTDCGLMFQGYRILVAWLLGMAS